jgi:hypothetical protein
MTAITAAMARASRGLDWSYPCLIWIADYVRDATGKDPAEALRHVVWDQRNAQRHLKRLAKLGTIGDTDVERALDYIARRDGWIEADAMMQGATMIGVFDAAMAFGPVWQRTGAPAIFDGQNRWLCSTDGASVSSVGLRPKRMWEIPNG